ncbi:hypothetical protein [Catellatospora citrea]|uniref:Uncharacterized protein n=1 Tax=Catellatospora citrea TaxID=53366 RepID=A0A8J3KLJ6_9ACTN|nr:hypothetical protein [Catellatospora citrea]RKE13015.1 hypothetical protein C8E86_7960 [Catellatospora citrea]GIG03230.1 hypothetical protein Cci01nite_83230 [Catellatospora citrea]
MSDTEEYRSDDEESSGKVDVLVKRARVAQVLDWPQLAVVAAGLAGQLPGPRLGPWRLDKVYEYALEQGRGHRVPLHLWPEPTRPAEFWNAIDLPGAVALRWGTQVALVSMVWTLSDEPQRPYDRDLVELLPHGDFVVRVCHDFGTAGPNLDWLRRGCLPSDCHRRGTGCRKSSADRCRGGRARCASVS